MMLSGQNSQRKGYVSDYHQEIAAAGLGMLAAVFFALVCWGNPVWGEQQARVVLHCRLDTEVNDGMAALVRRLVEREAVRQPVAAIVLEVDTFGGRVDSAIEITEILTGAPCQVVAWVTGKGAISAGALICYASDVIVMAPGTSIGASAPILVGAPAGEEVTEKSMSFLRAKFRALGEMKGHNPLLGEAMVDEQIELYGWPDPAGGYRIVKIENGSVAEESPPPDSPESTPPLPNGEVLIRGSGEWLQPPLPVTPEDLFRQLQPVTPEREAITSDPDKDREKPKTSFDKKIPEIPEGLPPDARLITASGKLLTLTAGEAVEFGLVRGLASSVSDALRLAGQSEDYPVLTVQKRWDERIFSFLTHPLISGLLLMCGVIGVYMEMKTPGFGWYGLIGLSCLALFMGARMVLGLSDWFDVALILVGFTLIALEIFYIPGFGWVGIGGLFCVFFGLYLALTRVPIPRYTWDFERLADAGVTMAFAGVSCLVLAYAFWKYLPQTALGGRLFLRDTQQADAGWVAPSPAAVPLEVGARGTTLSMLRPAGKALFDGRILDVETEGSFIDPGRSVMVMAIEGNRILVREDPSGSDAGRKGTDS